MLYFVFCVNVQLLIETKSKTKVKVSIILFIILIFYWITYLGLQCHCLQNFAISSSTNGCSVVLLNAMSDSDSVGN